MQINIFVLYPPLLQAFTSTTCIQSTKSMYLGQWFTWEKGTTSSVMEVLLFFVSVCVYSEHKYIYVHVGLCMTMSFVLIKIMHEVLYFNNVLTLILECFYWILTYFTHTVWKHLRTSMLCTHTSIEVIIIMKIKIKLNQKIDK